MKIAYALALALSLLSVPTHPQTADTKRSFSDGNHLLEMCSGALRVADSASPTQASNDEQMKFQWCSGYVQATYDRMFAVKIDLAILASAGLRFSGPENVQKGALRMIDPLCTPNGVTTLQIIRVTVKWLQDHPEKLHEPQSGLIIDAVKNAFPCGDEDSQPADKK